jgi:hypothetical protein
VDDTGLHRSRSRVHVDGAAFGDAFSWGRGAFQEPRKLHGALDLAEEGLGEVGHRGRERLSGVDAREDLMGSCPMCTHARMHAR